MTAETTRTIHWILGVCATVTLAVTGFWLAQVNGKLSSFESSAANYNARLTVVETQQLYDNRWQERMEKKLDTALEMLNRHMGGSSAPK